MANKPSLSGMQRMFVLEYLKHGDKLRAAREAGYKSPQTAAYELTNPEKSPLVAAKIAELQQEIERKGKLTAQYVRDYIFGVLDFCPGDYFQPGGEGGWTISEEAYATLPREIKRMIEETEFRETTNETTGETKRVLWVRFVSKTAAMNVAAKYTLTQKIETEMKTINWDDLYRAESRTKDEVEERIREVEKRTSRITVVPEGERETGGDGGGSTDDGTTGEES